MQNRTRGPLHRIKTLALLCGVGTLSIVNAQQWSGGMPQHKNIRALAQSESAPSTFYAGAFGWGVFKSIDGGTTWVNKRTGLKNGFVRSLLCLKGDTLLAGTNDGIFISIDGGAHWNGTLSTGHSVRAFVNDSAAGTLYAGTFGEGVYKSTNRGATWNKINVTDVSNGYTLVHLHCLLVTGKDTVFAGGSILDIATGGALFRSCDGGRTWLQVQKTIGIRSSCMVLTIDPANPKHLLMGTAAKGVYESVNNGMAWTNGNAATSPAPLSDLHVYGLAVSGGKIFAALDSTATLCYRGVYDTLSGWKYAAGLPQSKMPVMSLLVENRNTMLFAGTDGAGVYKSSDGTSWTVAADGMMGTGTSALAACANGTVIAGMEFGDGIWRSLDQGGTWEKAETLQTSNSVTSLAVVPTGTILFAGTYGSGVFKSLNDGRTWLQTDTTGVNRFIKALAADPSNANTVYCGTTRGVYKTVNGGTSWSALQNGMPSGTGIRCLAVDPVNPQIVFAGSDSAYLFRSGNGGSSWTNISTGFLQRDRFIRTIAVNPFSNDSVWAGCDSGRMYLSTNGGVSWTLYASLPTPSSVRTILFTTADRSILYAATFGGGIYKSVNGGKAWSSISTGLPDQSIYTIALQNGKLFAGTDAYGIYTEVENAGIQRAPLRTVGNTLQSFYIVKNAVLRVPLPESPAPESFLLIDSRGRYLKLPAQHTIQKGFVQLDLRSCPSGSYLLAVQSTDKNHFQNTICRITIVR